MRRRAVLGLLLLGLLFLRVDRFYLSPATALGSDHLFSIVQWELSNFPDKWLHLLKEWLPGRGPSREERLALVEEYVTAAHRAQKERDRLEGLAFERSAGQSGGAIAREEQLTSRDYLDELLKTKKRLRARAEETIEAELSSVLDDVGLGSVGDFLFPPVDLHFGEPPTILLVSPRDRIELIDEVLLEPNLPLLERARIEEELLERHNLSALVSDLGGLATYPFFVSDVDTLRGLLQTTAHEWLHVYFFFRPLGQSIWSSTEMFTINETAADLAGRELGDMVFARMGGDLSVSPLRYQSGERRDPVFTREMRETRARAEELLAEGRIEEAEEYMKERWWRLRLAGYRLRKLNQAYFAFHGRYAEGPASVSPIGAQIRELRELLPDAVSFVKTMAGVSSYEKLLEVLEDLRGSDDRATAEARQPVIRQR